VAFFEDDGHRARLLVRELLDNPEGMRKLLADNLRPWVLLVAQYVRQGKGEGIIHDDVDEEAYVMNVIVLVLANIAIRSITEGVLGGDAEDTGYAREMRELFRLSRTALFKR
jgi:hypothetical protein